MAGEIILIVDDEANVRTALTRILKRVGYASLEAEDAESALEQMMEHKCACAITDLRMPGVGGHGFIREAQRFDPSMPIIAMSGNADMDDVIECLRHGVSDFLRKPWSDAEVRSAVQRAIEKGPWGSPSASQVPAAPVAATTGAIPPVGAKPAPVAPETVVAVAAPNAAAAESPLARILERLRSGEIPVPAQPSVAITARALARNDHGSASQMKEIIEPDPFLAGRIIKIANSPYYAGVGRVTDLRAAIARVGFREIATLVDALIARRFHEVKDPVLKPLVDAAWRHTWTRAVATRALAEQLGGLGIDPEDAYLSALFCDIGAAFLCKVLSEVSPTDPGNRAFIAEHHAAVGGTIADAWKLPYPCAEVCRRHHSGGEPADLPPMLRLICAAEPIAIACGSSGDVTPITIGAKAQSALGLSQQLVAVVQLKVANYVSEHSSEVLGDA